MEELYDDIMKDINHNLVLYEEELKSLVEKMKENNDNDRPITFEFFKKKCENIEGELNKKIEKFYDSIESEKKKLKEFFTINDDNNPLGINIKIRKDIGIPGFFASGATIGGLAAGGLHLYTGMTALMYLDYLMFYGLFTICGSLALGLCGVGAFGINKIINIQGKKNDIQQSFENFFENFTIIKIKIKNKIEEYYNESLKEIDDFFKSQEQEMSNIYYNIEKWNIIVDKFLNVRKLILQEYN